MQAFVTAEEFQSIISEIMHGALKILLSKLGPSVRYHNNVEQDIMYPLPKIS